MHLCVSLDGIGRWHDKTRYFSDGTGSFNHVVRSINRFQSAGIVPVILTTVTEANIQGIPELTQFLIERDLPFRYGVYRDTSGGRYSNYDEFIDDLLAVLDISYDNYEEAIRVGKTSFHHQVADIRIDRKMHLFRFCRPECVH